MSTKKLFVSNLPYEMTEEELESIFAECGEIESVKIIINRDSGKSKGFAFIEMKTEEGFSSAIERLNGAEYKGRQLRVNEARSQENQPRGGAGGFGGGNGGGRPRRNFDGDFGGGGGGGRPRNGGGGRSGGGGGSRY